MIVTGKAVAIVRIKKQIIGRDFVAPVIADGTQRMVFAHGQPIALNAVSAHRRALARNDPTSRKARRSLAASSGVKQIMSIAHRTSRAASFARTRRAGCGRREYSHAGRRLMPLAAIINRHFVTLLQQQIDHRCADVARSANNANFHIRILFSGAIRAPHQRLRASCHPLRN
jgi:hypothetical protein